MGQFFEEDPTEVQFITYDQIHGEGASEQAFASFRIINKLSRIRSEFCFMSAQCDLLHLGCHPLMPFKSFCESPQFLLCCETRGVSNPAFAPHINKRLESRFLNAIWECNPCFDDETLCIVFHGTRSERIANILENGLDPGLRTGQLWGPGEYFGVGPRVSLNFTMGCNQMLVFVVMVQMSEVEKWWIPRSSSLSGEAIVVENNLRQLPLGVLSFE